MKTKNQKKKADKVAKDMTFGLKNKNKSKTVQKFVKGVEQAVKFAGVSMSRLEADEFEKRKQKKKEQEEAALLSSLYNDVNRLKEEDSDDEDPANVVCPYFKQGLCQKGKKCIYSHDMMLDRTEIIDLYVDQRTQLVMNAIGGKQMSSLSEEELNKLIGDKEREYIKGCKSDIVCKHFLEAVEKDKYGWNWTCPNSGDRCKYKHCLPPGYRLKREGAQVQEEKIDIEEKIDQERNRLLAQNKSSPLVTYEVFLKWKEDRRIKKEAEIVKKKVEEEKKNKNKALLRTGRELFSIDPTLFIDDEQAADEYEQEEIVEEEIEEEKTEKVYEDEEGEEGEEEEQLQKEEQEHEQTQHEQQVA